MQEHRISGQNGTDEPRSNTLLVDAATLMRNREGRLSHEQLKQFRQGISLERWLSYPIWLSLFCSFIILLIFGFGTNWFEALIVWGLLYALFLWIMADEFFERQALN